MRIIIVGAGKVGLALTQQLSKENQVTVIDHNYHLIDNIINIHDVMGVCGNGAIYEVQKEAEAEKADLLIAHHLQRRDQHCGVPGGQEAGRAPHHRPDP